MHNFHFRRRFPKITCVKIEIKPEVGTESKIINSVIVIKRKDE